jgi:hypothetical protein
MDDRTTEKPIVVTKNRARAGVTGHNVRYVLLWGTTLVAVLFAAIWLYYFT